MSVEQIIAQYGVVAVFLGAGVEGEAAVMAGGVLAHQGLVSPVAAAGAAVAGSFAADQAFFRLGRWRRDGALVRRLRGRPVYARAMAAFERRPRGFIFAYRFFYGLRTVSPIAIGTSGVSGRLFAAVNLVAAIVWGASFTTIGYLFGDVLEEAVGRITGDRLVRLVAAAAVVAIAAGLAFRRWRGRA